MTTRSTSAGRLYTVGHGTLDSKAFVALLRTAGIAHVVDVRRYPGSRRNPQFGREPLAATLTAEGIAYRWEEALGGRRSAQPDSPNVGLRDKSFRAYADHMASAPFRTAVRDLIAEAADAPTAVLCAESVWWRCHRRLVADHAVLVERIPVMHLHHDGRLDPHLPTDAARRDGPRVVYDVGVTPPLPG
jgi:uncharacterized protein (DUF488 family)